MSKIYIVFFQSQETGSDNRRRNAATQTGSVILVSADIHANTAEDTVYGARPRMDRKIPTNYTIPNEYDEVTHLWFLFNMNNP